MTADPVRTSGVGSSGRRCPGIDPAKWGDAYLTGFRGRRPGSSGVRWGTPSSALSCGNAVRGDLGSGVGRRRPGRSVRAMLEADGPPGCRSRNRCSFESQENAQVRGCSNGRSVGLETVEVGVPRGRRPPTHPRPRTRRGTWNDGLADRLSGCRIRRRARVCHRSAGSPGRPVGRPDRIRPAQHAGSAPDTHARRGRWPAAPAPRRAPR
jgi:hypothetical protein